MIQIEIWSDLVCPFCYIGKRNLEAALKKLNLENDVAIEWKSFQLDPYAKKDSKVTTYEYLSKKYGRPIEWAKEITRQTAETAAKAGLEFHFEKAIPTNTLDAHRLLHLAKESGLQGAFKERLLKAHFTEGENLSDHATLKKFAVETGVDGAAVDDLFSSDRYRNEVNNEAQAAQSYGASGVPFFVFNQKYAISGAQPVEAFIQVLEKTR